MKRTPVSLPRRARRSSAGRGTAVGGITVRCGETASLIGDVAQLVERLLCKQDVRSSNLLVSTFGSPLAAGFLHATVRDRKTMKHRSGRPVQKP